MVSNSMNDSLPLLELLPSLFKTASYIAYMQPDEFSPNFVAIYDTSTIKSLPPPLPPGTATKHARTPH